MKTLETINYENYEQLWTMNYELWTTMDNYELRELWTTKIMKTTNYEDYELWRLWIMNNYEQIWTIMN